MKRSDQDANLITRRRLTKLAGATAASAAIPPVAAAQNAKPVADRRNALDHVVVCMFKNRSFDNLLGRLYQPGEIRSFEGVLGKDLKNPIPEWAEHGADRKFVAYGVAPNMNTPHPDPGEEYPTSTPTCLASRTPEEPLHAACAHGGPVITPDYPRQQPTMDGFVADYISAFTTEMRRQPTYEEYSQTMMGYTPEHMPVLSSLGRGFATSTIGFATCLRRPSPTAPFSMQRRLLDT